jgi:hypothetical protein
LDYVKRGYPANLLKFVLSFTQVLTKIHGGELTAFLYLTSADLTTPDDFHSISGRREVVLYFLKIYRYEMFIQEQHTCMPG